MTDEELNHGTDCPACGYPFPAKRGSYTEPIDHDCVAEKDEPLWGESGPTVGQVITIAGTNVRTRWNGFSWDLER